MKSDKPSSTALLIGKGILLSSVNADVRPLLPVEMVRYTREFVRAAHGNLTVLILEVLGTLKVTWAVVRLMERLTVPGMIIHYILRKRRLDEWLGAALERGTRQVIIIGAGLDTIGIRSAERYTEKYKDLHVLEIDHPATQSVKRKAIDLGYIKQPKNFELLACDLANMTLKDALLQSKSFTKSVPTMLVAEGLFMYLAKEDVGKTISILKDFPAGSSFVFSYMLLDEKSRPAFRDQGVLTTYWLARKKEHFVWGESPSGIEVFVRRFGLSILNQFSGDDLNATYLEHLEKEGIVTARGENFVSVAFEKEVNP
jgi:methyltransferase (TIGR00027 family)